MHDGPEGDRPGSATTVSRFRSPLYRRVPGPEPRCQARAPLPRTRYTGRVFYLLSFVPLSGGPLELIARGDNADSVGCCIDFYNRLYRDASGSDPSLRGNSSAQRDAGAAGSRKRYSKPSPLPFAMVSG